MSFPPSVRPIDDVQRVLVVTAHPDDVDFSAAGTIATWTKAGIEVAYAIATSGGAGGFDDTPREEMTALRESEQRAAAAVVGVTDVTFLGYPDGALYVTDDLRRDITRQIRRVRPDRIVTTSPVRDWARVPAAHGDHVRIGEATFDAVYPDARNPFAHETLLRDEGLEAWTVREMWFSGTPTADHGVDITDVFEQKLTALREHRSQLPGDFEAMRERLLQWNGANAKAAGLPDGRLAELFSVISTA
ncbi:PIG-L deacetylase family protein [Cryptosporangium phraense]|uniref:PIG-L family deacetylase n=1 Tax=Cryptosporangium phraense TaxID=2593070 RepID=A0A545AUB5_9ACTN|nr:PIG-L deacetylase family protein [Cryptosporangium phraense]TQS44930.1 PIG-L family deacetylase [Cryptosporangium phraense]